MDESYLKQELVKMLRGGDAHATFDDTISGFPAGLMGVKPVGAPHTAWQLLEHLRIAQWDILEFTWNPKHVSPAFPSGYWPEDESPPDDKAWDSSVAAFKKDLHDMQQLVRDPDAKLADPLAHGDGQTIFREAVVVASHNSYHLGQLMFLRRTLEK